MSVTLAELRADLSGSIISLIANDFRYVFAYDGQRDK
jgi:hypothetical protein